VKSQVAKWIVLQIEQYRRAKGVERDILRNRIYKLLQPHLMSCIRNYLRDRKQYDNDVEVTSISWDGFLKGLQSYKHNEQKELVKHFQSCCIRHVRKSYRVVLREVEFKESEVDKLYYTCPDTTLDGLMMLQSFRETLPGEYQIVLDDLLNGTSRTFRTEETPVVLSENRYRESKKCFKMMIEFLLRRG
jgi:hypothetical protein